MLGQMTNLARKELMYPCCTYLSIALNVDGWATTHCNNPTTASEGALTLVLCGLQGQDSCSSESYWAQRLQ